MDFWRLVADLDEDADVSHTKPQTSSQLKPEVSPNKFTKLHPVAVSTSSAINKNAEASNKQEVEEHEGKEWPILTTNVTDGLGTNENSGLYDFGTKKEKSFNATIPAFDKEIPGTSEIKYYYQEGDPYEGLINQTMMELGQWKEKEESSRMIQHDGRLEPDVAVEPAKSTRQTKDKRCPFCHEFFVTIQSLRRHVERKHPESKDDLVIKYVQGASVKEAIQCQICNKVFANVFSLQYHNKRSHLHDRRFGCSLCGKKYPVKSELRKHLQRSHKGVEVEAFIPE